MRQNIIKSKSFFLAVRIIECYKHLVQSKKEFVISRQLLKSGTSIGALIREAEHAESKADFIHKLSISLKEANETLYWIELLEATKFLEGRNSVKLKNETEEVLKILVKILKTLRKSEN